ncbi:tricorn interacting aminopeptidase F1. Serine peptidase. MEROPS family S33 [Alicyclobacillus vulcanalis]|uniref:Proline iminopeptidase n=2 Tax=Alicyclobacillus vulcanalis TaxID=252246 RepID=A0A1N7JR00_9BACL|nr:tricorn interacting aminopeptidase F1. Serine peptidase. MEROPS family S33 [Alicyclobacillus vulcanalis]
MPHDYLEPLAELSDERPVIFYDQLACGLSDHVPDVSVLDVSWFTSELELVRQALGLEQFHLFGHSWGGWLALQYTLDFQPTLASLTICSSPASARDFVLGCAELRAQLPPDIDGVLRAYEELQDYRHPIYQKAVQEFYFRHFCRLRPWPDVVSRSLEKMSVEVYMHMWGPAEFGPVDGVLKDWSVETRVREIQVPALVVCGRYDEARPSYMSRLASGLSGPVEFHVFENSSHLAFWEDKDNFLRVLRSFLRQWDP